MTVGSWWVLRRARGEGPAVVAAFIVVALVAAVASLLAAYTGSVTTAGLRQQLRGDGTGTSLQVTAATGGDAAALDASVRKAVGTTYGPVAHTTWLSGVSGSQTIVGRREGGQDLLAVVAFYADLPARARLVDGHWPTGSGGEVQAALLVGAATRLGLQVGDQVALTDRISGRASTVDVVGTYRLADPDAAFWDSSVLEHDGIEKGGFTTYGPFVVDRGVFTAAFATSGAQLRWRTALDVGSLDADQAQALAGRLDTVSQRLQDAAGPTTAALRDATVTTGLPSALRRAVQAATVARTTVAVPVLALALLMVGAVLLVGTLLGQLRRSERGLLSARGAGGPQTASWTLREVVPTTVVAAAVGVGVAAGLARAVDGWEPLRRAGVHVTGTWSTTGIVAAVLAAVVAGLLVALPQLAGTAGRDSPSRLGRGGVDLVLVIAAGVGYWQLRSTGSVRSSMSAATTRSSTLLGVDPLTAVVPALLLLAGAVVLLRLLLPIAVLVDRLAARRRGLTAALAGWEVARRPARQTAATLLVVLAVALGVLAAGYGSSAHRSEQDQAAFTTGADVRVDLPAPGRRPDQLALPDAYASLPGVRASTPVTRLPLSVAQTTGTALLVDADQAAQALAVRPDLSPVSPSSLFARLAHDRTRPQTVALPPGTTELRMAVSATAAAGSPPIQVVVALRDQAGQIVRRAAGQVPTDGQPHPVSAAVPTTPTTPELLAVELLPLDPSQHVSASDIEVSGLAAVTGTGAPVPLPRSGWTTATIPSTLPVVTRSVGAGTVQLHLAAAADRVLLGRENLAAAAPATVDAVVSRSLLAAAGLTRGDGLAAQINGTDVRLRVTGVLAAVPTIDDGGPSVLVDLATMALRAYVGRGAATALTGLAPTQWWLSTDGPGAVAALAASPQLADGVVDRAVTAARLRDAPLAVGIAGAMRLAVLAAAVFAALGLAVGITITAKQRREQFAVLRALGLSSRRLTVALLTEQVLVGGLAVALGVGLGVLVTELVVPAVLLTAAGSAPVPAVVVVMPWAVVLGLAVAVIAVIALGSAALAAPVRRIELGRALREGQTS